MNPPIFAIVQARMGSTRFPGKMLKKLGNYHIIDWVINRLKRSNNLDGIVLATTTLSEDDVLQQKAKFWGVDVFRGSNEDVLGRFDKAARYFEVNTIVRVCGDNPFVAPEEIDRLIEFFDNNPCDYACNHQNRLGSGYADGFGAEIFSSNLLNKIKRLTTKIRHREHITLYLWENRNKYKLKSVPAPDKLHHSDLCFDIDTIEDKETLDWLINCGVNMNSQADEIINIYLSNYFKHRQEN